MAVNDDEIYMGYAPVYAAIGQAWVGLQAWTTLQMWLTARSWRGQTAADWGCGTGEVAVALAEAGYAVIGVDIAAAMLARAADVARSRGVAVTWHHGDIRDWTPPETAFDLVVSFYDTFNYLTDDGALADVIERAGAALRGGGVLAFDVNTLIEYASWDERATVTADNANYFVYNILHFDAVTQRAEGRIVWFERVEAGWRRGEETHIQRPWRDAEIVAALQTAGFTLEARLTLEGAPANPATATRILYIAQRTLSECSHDDQVLLQ